MMGAVRVIVVQIPVVMLTGMVVATSEEVPDDLITDAIHSEVADDRAIAAILIAATGLATIAIRAAIITEDIIATVTVHAGSTVITIIAGMHFITSPAIVPWDGYMRILVTTSIRHGFSEIVMLFRRPSAAMVIATKKLRSFATINMAMGI